MKSICAVALILLALSVAHAEDAESSNVIVLTDANFEAEVNKYDILLIEFYAPWCGHCKALEPKYVEASNKLMSNPETKHLRIAKMDADKEKMFPGKFGVSSFPTIKLFRMGEYSEDFEGERTAEGIIEFMKKKDSAATNKEITSTDALKQLTSAKTVTKVTIVGFFSTKEGVDYKIFKQVVAQFAASGIEVYHTATSSVLESYGFYSDGSSIQMFRPHAAPFKIVYRGTIFKQSLKDWILESAVPQVGVYSADTEKLYQLSGAPVIRFIGAGSSPVKKEFIAKLAAAHKDIKFATSDVANYASDVEAHCDKGVTVCVIGQEGTKSKRNGVFGLSGAFSEAAVETFIADFLAKKLTAKVKSEPKAPAPAAGEVAVVVGTSFTSIVLDETKDVFIEFYAPWCGHCKALAPKYDELAKGMAGSFDKVVIAKMDLTANDLPAEFKGIYEVSGFPTLYFAPKGSKRSPVKFDGARDVEPMKKWIEEHLSK